MYEVKQRKSDEIEFIDSVSSYIPITIHYANDCLLTKNGELLKIITIDGINSQNINSEIFQIKSILKQAISETITDNNYAIWIHTFRTKVNLDDPMPYNKFLSKNIHELWAEKNYWHDKYANVLYITILYKNAEIKIKNFDSLTNSLFPKVISDFQNAYLDKAFNKLTNTVEKFFKVLEPVAPRKLSIKSDGNNYISELLTFYHSIIGVNTINNLVIPADISDYLSEQVYAVGHNFINITDKQGDNKFVAMLSLKEYQEVSNEALDKILQLPLEFIITEIFYLVDKKLVTPSFTEQQKFLNVTNDKKLGKANAIDEIMSNDPAVKFCKQQIMMCIVGREKNELEANVKVFSNVLNTVGIVHVREDIIAVPAFWAQLPGNFAYMQRVKSNLLRYAGVFSLLHYSPIGNQYNVWGRAVTLLRTIKGTPYFFGFHRDKHNGNTAIMGELNKGKTILTNFLLSESTKFNPRILYLASNNDSQIFIESLEGQWLEIEKNIVNPLLVEDNDNNKEFLLDFFKIILNHYKEPLKENELTWLKGFITTIVGLEPNKRSLSALSINSELFINGGENIQTKLSMFIPNAKYAEVFERQDNIELINDIIKGINFNKFSEEYFTKHNLPEDKRYLAQFNQDLHAMNNIRLALIYALSYFHSYIDNNHKIIVADNMLSLINVNYTEIIAKIYNMAKQANGIVLANFELKQLLTLSDDERFFWLQLNDTTIILSLDVQVLNLDKKLQLEREEIEKLKYIKNNPRLFLLKQGSQSVILELSLGGFIGILKILSAKTDDINLYNKIKQENNNNIEEWLPKLNKKFEEQ